MQYILKECFYIAGGLATYLHADYVRTLLPDTVKFHAMPDAG